MLREGGGNPGGALMISAVHMFQSQWIQWGKQEVLFVSKSRVWTDMRAFNRSYSYGLNRVESGWQTTGESASTALVLVYWFWLLLVSQSGTKWGGGTTEGLHWEGLGISHHAGRGGRRGLHDVFVLTAVMHGVAGDDHRWGHGDGSTPHGELVGDGIVSTAAAEAWLARSGSWKEGKSITFNIPSEDTRRQDSSCSATQNDFNVYVSVLWY